MASALDTTMSAGSSSPLASRTPVARPPSTVMRDTSALQRSRPPTPSSSFTMPDTSAPVPPMAQCTPNFRSSAWMRL